MYSQDRKKQREFLASAWQKHLNKEHLEPLETQLALIIESHPEYHKIIKNISSDYFPEQGEINPFLHINLHLALKDQLSINHPQEISSIYEKLLKKYNDPHEVEHLMMECIAEMIFASQRNNTELDHEKYILSLNNLLH